MVAGTLTMPPTAKLIDLEILIQAKGQQQRSVLFHCQDLQELVLRSCSLDGNYHAFEGLSRVTKLTALTLDAVTYGEDKELLCLHPLTCLPNLQQLVLRKLHEPVQDFLAGICYISRRKKSAYQLNFPALTSLEIHNGDNVELSMTLTPHLLALTRLRKLIIHDIYRFDPSLLKSFTALEHLELHTTPFEHGSEASLVAVLRGLQKLRVLSFVSEEASFDDLPDWELSAAAYAAFTANRNLQILELVGVPFPDQSTWQRLFSQGHSLPLLMDLTLQPAPEDDSRGSGVQSLANCCSGLQRLVLEYPSQPTAQQLRPITELQKLLELGLFGAGREAGRALAQLTRLTKLSVGAQFDDVGLLQVTGLTALREFCRMNDVGKVSISKVAPPGPHPDVADRILDHCRNSIHCQPVLELQAQLAEQAGVLAATQQQLAEREQQLSAAQHEALDLRKQLQNSASKLQGQ